MLSVSHDVASQEAAYVEGPNPEDVMRHYLRLRMKTLKRERAGQLMGTTAKNADHIRDGRRGISMAEVAAVSGEKTTADLFGALAEISRDVQRGDAKIRVKPLDVALEAGKQKLKASKKTPSQTAKEAAAPKAHPSKQSPDKPRRPPSEPVPRPSGQ